jgi:hypothetical protein
MKEKQTTQYAKDLLPFEKWIFRKDDPVRDDEHIMFCINELKFYTDISCLGGVFAKNTSRKTKNFPIRTMYDCRRQDRVKAQVAFGQVS